jgi:S-adenosylmethionine hydrolase
MSIITLTTDFGIKDYAVGAVKAALMTAVESIQIVDISHEVSPYNQTECAYILKNAYHVFPKGSIHIIGVESELTPENQHIAVLFDGHYFIGGDNGIMSLIMDGLKPEKVVVINIHNNVVSSFPVLDVFVHVAAHLARKGKLEVIGKPIDQIKELTELNPVINIQKNQIIGSVIYIDNYGNIVTNITKKIFSEIGKTRSFTIYARTVKFTKIYSTYSEAIDFSLPPSKRAEDGKKLALFNAAGHLELAIYKSNPKTVGGATSLFGLEYRDSITIIFD